MVADRKKFVIADDEAPSEIRARAPTLTDEAALEEARLASIPSSPPHALDPLASLRAELEPMDRVPVLVGTIGEHAVDPRTAFVLGFVDGILPLETIVDVAGLPEDETLIILAAMMRANVIVFRPTKAFPG